MLSSTAICRRLLKHCVRLADSRALLSVGSRMPINTAMMPMTTRSSTSVKPRRRADDVGWILLNICILVVVEFPPDLILIGVFRRAECALLCVQLRLDQL